MQTPLAKHHYFYQTELAVHQIKFQLSTTLQLLKGRSYKKNVQGMKKSGKEGRVPCCFGGRTLYGLRGKSASPSESFWKRQSQEQQPGKSQERVNCNSCQPGTAQGCPNPQDHGCSSEGRQESPPGYFPELQEKVMHCWNPPSISRLCKDADTGTAGSCSQMLSGVSPNSPCLEYPRWKSCEESL